MRLDSLRRLVPDDWRPGGYLRKLVRDRTGQRVAAGPFAGMRYIRSAYFSTYIPKLLGIYERELAAVVEAGIALEPDRVVDVGAAEGYYAVGLALRNPQAKVEAFEMSAQASEQLREMIALNGVEGRVRIHGKCEPDDLAGALAGAARPLVVCDVESYELTLLDPARVGGLEGAHVLVELHDLLSPGLAETIEARFQSTHRVTRIWQEERTVAEFPYATWYTRLLSERLLAWYLSELRGERMSWFWMEPRGDAARVKEGQSEG